MPRELNVEKDEEAIISRINSAGIINITIENLWRESYSAMTKADLVTWNRKLDAIWLILGGDVNPGDPKEKEFYEIEEKIYKTGSLRVNQTGFKKVTDDDRNKSATQYVLLRKKALFLRRLQNQQGKGTAYADASEDDFE